MLFDDYIQKLLRPKFEPSEESKKLYEKSPNFTAHAQREYQEKLYLARKEAQKLIKKRCGNSKYSPNTCKNTPKKERVPR